MAGQWKAQAIERDASTTLAELAAYDPRGRVKLYCGRCGQEMTSIERHYEQHGGMPLAKEVAR